MFQSNGTKSSIFGAIVRNKFQVQVFIVLHCFFLEKLINILDKNAEITQETVFHLNKGKDLSSCSKLPHMLFSRKMFNKGFTLHQQFTTIYNSP